ncbi:type I DNA topoisomerase [Patescibacteria group bacterium]|nr:MAG: type I DNA topoisomerase [Patescibacteria group bacterium]
MAGKVLIVESPAKAKTVSKYLEGEYEVIASVGHIRDLPKGNNAIDIEGGFIPHYEIVKGKEKVIESIKRHVARADEVLLATDPDREGEAIAWHIAQIIKDDLGNSKSPARPRLAGRQAAGGKIQSSKSKGQKIKRITYHEITKEAIQEALKHPRDIDINLKTAQEARRVLDRLVGYDLSGLIWKKVRYGLSAGRVQSPALRILMEREREIRAFLPEGFWTIAGQFKTESGDTITLTCEEEPRDKKEVDRIVRVGKAKQWSVVDVKETEITRVPRAPFITSTLQQAASSRLGFSPSRTMRIAQRLYEAGLITYMRTDSTSLSVAAQKHIAGVIEEKFGKVNLSPRVYKTKSKTAQEAHEAIRPTDASKEDAGANEEQKKLYKLIWQRTVASQMANARILRTKVSANVTSKSIPDFSVVGSRVLFEGWLSADPRARQEDIELPKLKAGDPLTLLSLDSQEKETTPPPRYSEAGLIKELEKRGIGRPSTYATIVETLVNRGYVTKIERSLMPTDTGDVVSSFLENNFAKYISDSFTAEMEDELDEIADGKREYVATLKSFYAPFSKDVKAKEKIEKITTLGEADKKWKCPKCGSGMVIKLGRTGKFLSCERFPECHGARTIDGEALDGPKDTGEVCPECGKGTLVERDGKFGRFIACSRYPRCKYVKRDEAELEKMNTGVKCPLCGDGLMMERRGRYGVFYSCSNYPKCKNAIKAKPTGRLCDLCGSLMMQGTKIIPERCSNNKCLNYRPDKLGKLK